MAKKSNNKTASARAIEYIQQKGGMIRASAAIKAGIHPATLYNLRDSGVLLQISRGLYRLASLKPLSNPDIITVISRIPGAVICLISALSYYDITTQIPHKVYIALEKGAEEPRFDYPPISVHRFSKESFDSGIEEHKIDEIPFRIYSPEKTLADCFKFRNKIGLDVVIEALKLYKSRKKINPGELLKYAKICRVEKIMKPYLEVII